MDFAVARAADPGFQAERLRRAAFVSDPAPAELLFGLWIIALRGVMLSTLSFAYQPVEAFLSALSLTADRLGFMLFATGLAQFLAAGTLYYRLRAYLAFVGAFLSMTVWVAYMGVDLEHSTLAWSWFALTVAEYALCLRVRSYRRVTVDLARKGVD